MKIQKYATRWDKGSVQVAALKRITELIQKGGIVTSDLSPFAMVNNKMTDFRGLNLDGLVIKGSVFEQFDFSSSLFTATRITGSVFKNCIFNEVDFSNFSDHGNKFMQCDFSNCKFIKTAIGYDGSLFTKSIFKKCNFNKSIFARAEFVEAEFDQCKLQNLDFNGSSFDNCTFKGILNDVWFRGEFPLVTDTLEFGKPKKNEMKNVSFENADLIEVSFTDHCDLSSVRIKNNGNYIKYDNWYKRLSSLKKSAESWNDNKKIVVKLFIDLYMRHATKQDWDIINIDVLEKDYGMEVSKMIIDELNNGG